uniref:Transmembrane protein n=1 Tax=Haemonchus contortus TaxID=6289 RepID=A0A7I4Y7N1_HAECO
RFGIYLSFICIMEKVPKPLTRILPLWIEVWLVMSAVICFLDVMFTMLRPHTTEGFLSSLYLPWNLYASVDVRYADEKDVVTCGTGRVMLIEIVMNLIAVVMSRRLSRHALLTAFTTSAFVFWKTFWFLTLYVLPPAGSRSYFNDNSTYLDILLIFWIPNGFWVVMPFLVMKSLWNKLALPVNQQYHYSTVNTA